MSLRDRQAQLVAALVAGAADPAGFDSTRLAAARSALLRKRSGQAAGVWPRLAHSYGTRWAETFAAWARGRPSQGALCDGWDFALANRPTGPALVELRIHQVLWRRSGNGPPRRRRLPAIKLARTGKRLRLIVQVARRAFVF